MVLNFHLISNQLLNKDKIISAQFKDDLQGVYGFIDQKTFEKHKKMLLEMEHT
ncbi:MAG: hypothetical protein AB1668_02955 [Nanoarchaeota archaeon]